MNGYTEYRFTKKDGRTAFEFVEDGHNAMTQIRQFMRMHGASKAEPVAPPPCPACQGPVCPIVDFEEE